jgi:hypothetical protein
VNRLSVVWCRVSERAMANEEVRTATFRLSHILKAGQMANPALGVLVEIGNE